MSRQSRVSQYVNRAGLDSASIGMMMGRSFLLSLLSNPCAPYQAELLHR